jgi:hypothetical protein
VTTRINNVVFRIQQHPRAKIMVVHLDRLAPTPRGYLGWAALRREQCCKLPLSYYNGTASLV